MTAHAQNEGNGTPVKYTRKDFASDQDVRWCPGCGDYSILAQVQRAMPELGIARHNIVFISGIGCAARFPYYMQTYGFHTIHGRAPSIATGLSLSNPDLTVFVVSGDGDALSIGGNHLIHALRRNVNIKILLFNNKIYGLTKGQYSPTSSVGTRSKSTPQGSIDTPFRPLSVALGAEASFVARCIDTDAKSMQETITRMAAHKGSALLEILQNCPIFNDGVWEPVTDRKVRSERAMFLEHGKPLVFGPNGEKGIRLQPGTLTPEVVDVGEGREDLLIHDERAPEPTLASMLARMDYPDFPVPLGVLRDVQRPVYEEQVHALANAARERQGEGDVDAVLRRGHTWTVD